MNNLNFKPVSLFFTGEILLVLPLIITRYIIISDVFYGVLQGLGIGLLIVSGFLFLKHPRKHKKSWLPLLLAASILVSSCEKDDHIPQTDYSIESSSYFKVVSQHPNGWIKEAKHVGNQDRLVDKFTYYENGNIKSAKVYARFPQQHLYMEVSRSEDNKPLWSKYYTPDGDLWFETNYSNGLPSVKKVYSEKGTAVYSYTNGDLVAVEFTKADNSGTSTTIYDRTSGSKKVIVTQDGKTVLEEEYPYDENYGDGVLTSNQVPLANPFADTEGSDLPIGESFFHNPRWEFSPDPYDYMQPYRNYFEFYFLPSAKFATKFAVNSDLYQSVIEQYPVTEDEVLVMNYKYRDRIGENIPPFEERRALDKEMQGNPDLFELKYGNEYVKRIHFGKQLFIIGAIRNMPTDSRAAREIKKLAEKHINALLDGDNELTNEEMEILNKVWFEVKFFSTLKAHRNGIVLNTTEDYKTALQQFTDAESSAIQLEYIPFDHMISD